MASSRSPCAALATTKSASACSRPSPTCQCVVRCFIERPIRMADQRRKGSRLPPISDNFIGRLRRRPRRARDDAAAPCRRGLVWALAGRGVLAPWETRTDLPPHRLPEALDDGGVGQAAALAHGDEAVTTTGPLELVQER